MASLTPLLLFIRKWVTRCSYVLSLLMTAAWGHAEENRSFREVTFNVLGQQFQDFGSATSQETMERIARESGLTASEVRGKLRELLDEWEIQRHEKTEIWNDLVSRRSERVSAKQTEKFLEELSKSVREILGKEENFRLKSLSAVKTSERPGFHSGRST